MLLQDEREGVRAGLIPPVFFVYYSQTEGFLEYGVQIGGVYAHSELSSIGSL